MGTSRFRCCRRLWFRKSRLQSPAEWDLSQQNELIESLVGQGYNAVLVFPGDAVGTNKILGELDDAGIPTAALAGCVEQPTQAKFCFGTDTGHSAYLGTKELIKALGGKGKIAHFTGFLVDPNTTLESMLLNKLFQKQVVE